MQDFKVDYKLNLVSQMAAQEITLSSQRQIDTILLQSSQSIDLLGIEDKVCKENQIKVEEASASQQN